LAKLGAGRLSATYGPDERISPCRSRQKNSPPPPLAPPDWLGEERGTLGGALGELPLEPPPPPKNSGEGSGCDGVCGAGDELRAGGARRVRALRVLGVRRELVEAGRVVVETAGGEGRRVMARDGAARRVRSGAPRLSLQPNTPASRIGSGTPSTAQYAPPPALRQAAMAATAAPGRTPLAAPA
jgi:hypothetical protein